MSTGQLRAGFRRLCRLCACGFFWFGGGGLRIESWQVKDHDAQPECERNTNLMDFVVRPRGRGILAAEPPFLVGSPAAAYWSNSLRTWVENGPGLIRSG